MEENGTRQVPAWATREDRELRNNWQQYSYEDASRGWLKLVDRFAECLGYAFGGVRFAYWNRGPNEAPCILRLRGDGFCIRTNLKYPDHYETGWTPIGLAKKEAEADLEAVVESGQAE